MAGSSLFDLISSFFASPAQDWHGRPPYEVEWRVPVGCGFSGFFTEVALGFVPALHERISLRLLCGRCEETWLTSYLQESEAKAFRKVWVAESSRTAVQTERSLAIEHGEPCGMHGDSC